MRTSCCVPACTNRGGLRFPRDPEVRKKWIIAVRRDKWSPSSTSVVCHSHFDQKQFKEITNYGDVPERKTLKKGEVPCIFPWTPGKRFHSSDNLRGRKSMRKLFKLSPDKLNSEAAAPTFGPQKIAIGCKEKFKKTSRKTRKSQIRLKKTKLKKIVLNSRMGKLLAVQKSCPPVTCSPPTSSVTQVPVKTSPAPVKNICPVPSSPSIQSIQKATSQFTAQDLKVAVAVPKEGLAGKLVIDDQSCKMPDPNTLLRMLKLPPNVMFHINATSTRVFNKIIPKPPATSTVSSGMPKMPVRLTTELPVKSQFNFKTKVESQNLPIRPNDVIKREPIPVANIYSKWTKKETEKCDNATGNGEDEITVVNRPLEPIVEMYFESEEQTVNDVKSDQIVKDLKESLTVSDLKADQIPKDAKQTLTVNEIKTKEIVKTTMQASTVKHRKTEPFDGEREIPMTQVKRKLNLHASLRRSSRIRRTSIRMNDL